MHVWKMKLQKLLFSLGPRMCVKQHFHARCTSSQSIETDSLTLICKTTWLSQLPHMSHASESLLCEPSTNLYCQTDLGADWIYHFVTLLSKYFSTSVSFSRLVWSFNFQVRFIHTCIFCSLDILGKRRYQHEIADCKWQWIKKYFLMDLAENVLYHETFFHKAINHSVEFRCCTLERKDFTVNKHNSRSL